MAQALYRKYRSRSLDEIVGQKHVTDVLKNALNSGRITHAYLLTGPRGVGKTSIARILAHEINELPYSGDTNLDIIEIDAASNNGVDDVRDLREKVTIAPVAAKKKIYIIDEVHMLSKPAFNALLKTLEEPPEHVVFILATTEVHKLPDTILSRTQRFHFRPIAVEDMKTHLAEIAKKEKIKVDDEALELISARASGSFRDAISLLDQLSNLGEGEITAETIVKTLGLASLQAVEQLADAISRHQLSEALELLGTLESEGVSPIVLSEQLSHYLKSHIADHPELIELIEALIDVGRSHNPSLKLLASVATAAGNGEPKPDKPRTVALEATRQTLVIAKTPAPAKPKTAKKPTELKPVEWGKVLEYIRTNHVVLYGFLQKAEANFEGNSLNLHFAYSLHKKKIEEGRYRQQLGDSLLKLCGGVPDISLTSGKRPPKNERAAAVAAIMGGGEEVRVEG